MPCHADVIAGRPMFDDQAVFHPEHVDVFRLEVLADGFHATLAYLDNSNAESMAILRSLTPEQFNARCQTPDGAAITVWKWLRLMAEHEIHHRGQIYLYLSLLGVRTPPLYGLTSEEVRARSAEPAA